MKVLTIRQPWAGAIFERAKCVENRSWSTSYRGPLVIHAGARFDTGIEAQRATRPGEGPVWECGVILGTVELIDCRRDAASRWADAGAWHWILRNPKLLARSIVCKGKLGLWQLDDALARKLAA